MFYRSKSKIIFSNARILRPTAATRSKAQPTWSMSHLDRCAKRSTSPLSPTIKSSCRRRFIELSSATRRSTSQRPGRLSARARWICRRSADLRMAASLASSSTPASTSSRSGRRTTARRLAWKTNSISQVKSSYSMRKPASALHSPRWRRRASWSRLRSKISNELRIPTWRSDYSTSRVMRAG